MIVWSKGQRSALLTFACSWAYGSYLFDVFQTHWGMEWFCILFGLSLCVSSATSRLNLANTIALSVVLLTIAVQIVGVAMLRDWKPGFLAAIPILSMLVIAWVTTDAQKATTNKSAEEKKQI